jgi:hypothetical protein
MRVYLMPAAAVMLVALFFAFQSKEAPAAPIVDSGTFSLAAQQEEVVFNAQSETDVGVTVSVSTGSVQVQGTDAQGTTVLGTLNAGRAAVFEGEYLTMKVVAQGVASTGSYASRAPCDDLNNTDVTVGEVTAAISVSGTTQVYFGDASRERGITVSIQSGSIAIRTSPTGDDVAGGDAGEQIWIYDVNCSGWYVVGSGSILFDVQQVDANSPKTTESHWKSSGQDSTDTWNPPGDICITGNIKNEGPGNIHVRVTYQGGSQDPPPAGSPPESQTRELQPDEEFPFVCHVTQIFVQYDRKEGKAKVTHTPVPGA